MGICKNKSTEAGRKFWEHVESVAAQMDAATKNLTEGHQRLHRLLALKQSSRDATDEVIAERDREWCVALSVIGVAASAVSEPHGKISVRHTDDIF